MISKENWEIPKGFDYYPKADTYIMMRYEIREGRINGEFRHLYMEEEQSFGSFSEFIYKLQLFLEKAGSPQMTICRCRTWGEPGQCRTARLRRKEAKGAERPALLKEISMKGMNKTGKYYILHIRFCQNATWQGSIRWMDERQMIIFKSVLELLMVLEESLAFS